MGLTRQFNPTPKSNNYYSFSSCSARECKRISIRSSRNTIALSCMYVGESLHCLFFFFGDPDWLDQRWTRPMFAEVGARVTWGFGVGFGVVPAWLTFKTKPSGCSQAPYTGYRRIGKYSLFCNMFDTSKINCYVQINTFCYNTNKKFRLYQILQLILRGWYSL